MRIPVSLLVVVASLIATTSYAQTVEVSPLKNGFEIETEIDISVAEVLSQPDFWMMQVQFKKMRMLRTEVTNPKTGQKRREIIWYLIFRTVNRQLDVRKSIEDRRLAADTDPINPDEVELGFVIPRRLFIPQFTLVTTDPSLEPQIYIDEVLPEVHGVIERRERMKLRSMVDIVNDVPQQVAAGDPDEESKAVYGVAVWRNIEPKTDYFTLFFEGFSNGYRLVPGPSGEPIVARKTIVQDFWRPGDEFEQEEREIKFKGTPRWIYRVEPGEIDIPKVEEVIGIAAATEQELPAE